jgi:hypothetical protein
MRRREYQPIHGPDSLGPLGAGHRARLPGSPNRQMRESASIHRKAIRIPSAHASGFKGKGGTTTQ